MKLNIFVKNDCDFCAQVIIPEGINVNKINIDEGYSGYKPEQVPVLQHNGINLPGPQVINGILQLVKDSQDGQYKQD